MVRSVNHQGFGSAIAADQQRRGLQAALRAAFCARCRGEVSWLQCLSTPPDTPARTLDLHRHDPEDGNERGRLSLTRCWRFGCAQPAFCLP